MAFGGLLANYPNRVAAVFLRAVAFPLGLPHAPARDSLGRDVAHLMQMSGDTRERLVSGSHVSNLEADPIARGEKLLALMPTVMAMEKRLRRATRDGEIAPLPQDPDAIESWATGAVAGGFIEQGELGVLCEWARHTREAVKVDDFPSDFGILEALQKRGAALKRSLTDTLV